MTDQPITEADLARLDALCAAATEGPWTVQKPSWNRQGTPFKTAITNASGTVANAFTRAAWRGGFPQDQPEPSDTARFIAAARTALPALVAALRAAWRERDEAIQRERLAEQALGMEMRGRDAFTAMVHASWAVASPWLGSAEMIDLVAAWDHQAWAGWTAWMLDRLTDENIARWRRQIATPYADLSEAEKESDRREAREVLAIIMACLAGPKGATKCPPSP